MDSKGVTSVRGGKGVTGVRGGGHWFEERASRVFALRKAGDMGGFRAETMLYVLTDLTGCCGRNRAGGGGVATGSPENWITVWV